MTRCLGVFKPSRSHQWPGAHNDPIYPPRAPGEPRLPMKVLGLPLETYWQLEKNVLHFKIQYVKVEKNNNRVRGFITLTPRIHHFLLPLARLKRKQVIWGNLRVHMRRTAGANLCRTPGHTWRSFSSQPSARTFNPAWDFPPLLQLRSLISPKMQMSNHICHIFFDDLSLAICCFVMSKVHRGWRMARQGGFCLHCLLWHTSWRSLACMCVTKDYPQIVQSDYGTPQSQIKKVSKGF